MSLYQCEKCGCRENTATGCYWGRTVKLCSFCGEGAWHGKFKRKFLPKGQFHTNRDGNLQHTASGKTDLREFFLEVEEGTENSY